MRPLSDVNTAITFLLARVDVAQCANCCDARGGGGGDAAICCLALTEGPEWLDTNLVVSGHKDGSVRLWSVVPRQALHKTASQNEKSSDKMRSDQDGGATEPDVVGMGCKFELMLRRRVRAVSSKTDGASVNAPVSPSVHGSSTLSREGCGHSAEVTKILIDSDPFVRTMYTADAHGEWQTHLRGKRAARTEPADINAAGGRRAAARARDG